MEIRGSEYYYHPPEDAPGYHGPRRPDWQYPPREDRQPHGYPERRARHGRPPPVEDLDRERRRPDPPYLEQGYREQPYRDQQYQPRPAAFGRISDHDHEYRQAPPQSRARAELPSAPRTHRGSRKRRRAPIAIITTISVLVLAAGAAYGLDQVIASGR